MSDGLRECPHCGATRGLYTLDEYGGLCADNDLIVQIFCDNCKSAFENERANNGKELIKTWNTRAERTCYADEVTHRNCKYSVNRGWCECTCANELPEWYRFECSECGCNVEGGDEMGHACSTGAFRYCPNCGAKVKEER